MSKRGRKKYQQARHHKAKAKRRTILLHAAFVGVNLINEREREKTRGVLSKEIREKTGYVEFSDYLKNSKRTDEFFAFVEATEVSV